MGELNELWDLVDELGYKEHGYDDPLEAIESFVTNYCDAFTVMTGKLDETTVEWNSPYLDISVGDFFPEDIYNPLTVAVDGIRLPTTAKEFTDLLDELDVRVEAARTRAP